MMARIHDVNLELTEDKGVATLTVSYRLSGSPEDNSTKQIYAEAIELIGVDEGPGEDGQNEIIADRRLFTTLVRFPISKADSDRRRVLKIPSSVLDEDRGFGLDRFRRIGDEIRARVSLTPGQLETFTDSNVVRRGGLADNKPPLEPA